MSDNVALYAGLDYHQHSIQVCLMDQAGRVRLNKACRNDLETLRELLVSAGNVTAVSLEACCGAADLAEQLVACGSWNVQLAHAGYVSHLKGSPDKTDYSDARLLADLTRVGYLPKVWLAPAPIRDLRQMVAYRQRLVNQRKALKLQIGAMLREQRVKIDPALAGRWSQGWIQMVLEHPKISAAVLWIIQSSLQEIQDFSAKIQQADQKLREQTRNDPVIAKLRKIEGVGEVTSWTLRAHIGRFERFKNGKKLARYCGLSPKNVSSGEKQADAGLIDSCCQALRPVLIQAAHRLIRSQGRWKLLAERLIKKGKPRNVAVAAVANRWIRSMHHRMIEEG